MKTYIFSHSGYFIKNRASEETILRILARVSQDTRTDDLVVSVYLTPGKTTMGTAYVREWKKPSGFTSSRGKWAFTRQWPPPPDLPDRFKLIRICINGNPARYPLTQTDIYGWRSRYDCFDDLLAALFAHELHHYRRYHLGFHPCEGEQQANRWAFEHVQSLGYRVTCKRLPIRRKSKKRVTRFAFPKPDPFAHFRKCRAGDLVSILKDPAGRYAGQTAVVERPIRSNSKRIVIRTSDGKSWRWPMTWTKPDP